VELLEGGTRGSSEKAYEQQISKQSRRLFAAVMRERFGTVVGTSPLLYRRAFQR
jgi:hypothetical protein